MFAAPKTLYLTNDETFCFFTAKPRQFEIERDITERPLVATWNKYYTVQCVIHDIFFLGFKSLHPQVF